MKSTWGQQPSPAAPAAATSMGYDVFGKLGVDRKVEFTVAKQGAAYVVTSVSYGH